MQKSKKLLALVLAVLVVMSTMVVSLADHDVTKVGDVVDNVVNDSSIPTDKNGNPYKVTYEMVDDGIELCEGKWCYEKGSFVAPTCGDEGYYYLICEYAETKFCNARVKAVIAPTGEHDWVLGKVVEPTCLEAGTNVYSCSVCGDEKTEMVAALGHESYKQAVVNPANPLEAIVETLCWRCGEEMAAPESYDIYDHSHYNLDTHFEVLAPATCTKEGHKAQKCLICSDAAGEAVYVNCKPIKATGHSEEVETVPATCTSAGYTKTTCTECGVVLNYEVLPQVAHTFKTVILKAATCTEAALVENYCEVAAITLRLLKALQRAMATPLRLSMALRKSQARTLFSTTPTISFVKIAALSLAMRKANTHTSTQRQTLLMARSSLSKKLPAPRPVQRAISASIVTLSMA